MERSRTSRKQHWAVFFTTVLILGTVLLNGCGQHSTVSGALDGIASGQANFDDIGDQSGNNEQRPYLSLTPDTEAQVIKDNVAENDANKQFASQVVSATVRRQGNGAEIQLTVSGSQSPLIFKGDLTQDKLTYVGNFPESSGQRPDLTLYVSCTDQGCLHTDLFLSDQQGHKAAIVVNTEDRVLHTTIPDDETEEQVKSAGLEKFKQDMPVEYTSTEIFPGKTNYVVRTKSDKPEEEKTIFEGQVQDSDSGLVPAQSTAVDNTQTASLAGIDSDEAVFQITTNPDPKKLTAPQAIFFKVKKPDVKPSAPTTPVKSPNVTPTKTTATAAASVPPQCPVHLKGEVNPLVNDVLKECGQKRVLDEINNYWHQKDHFYTYTFFMNLYEASKTAQTPSKALDFKTMINILHANNFPTIWSWVTLRESTFDRNKPIHSQAEELGVWQISKATRPTVGLNDKTVLDIAPATLGAVTLYNTLLAKYHGNIPMVLAGYNMGLDGADNLMATRHFYTNDFWEICRTIPSLKFQKGPCDYVSYIISGMITSLDPKAWGMTNIGAMEAK